MKHTNTALLTIFAIIFSIACGAAEMKMSTVDLSAGGDDWKGMVIDVPAGAKATATSYSLTVNKGDSFQIELHTGSADIASLKTELRANEVNKLKSFAVDKPDMLLYSSDAGMGEEWHFVVNVKAASGEFYCEDVKGAVYSKSAAEAMIKSARTLRSK